MKIKKIKSIMIGDTKFKVIWDKSNRGGGEFAYPWKNSKAFIRISVKNEKINQVEVLNIIIHELKEIIQLEQSTRYTRRDADYTYEFHYNHKEHTDLCSRLAGLLSQFIK